MAVVTYRDPKLDLINLSIYRCNEHRA